MIVEKKRPLNRLTVIQKKSSFPPAIAENP